MRFSPVSSVLLSNVFYYYLLDCIWVTYGLITRSHSCPSQDSGGLLGSLILHWSNVYQINYCLTQEPQINYMVPLVQLGPLDPMGPHVLVTGVWGTLLDVNFHLLHVHASFWEPPRTIATFQEPLGVPTPTYFSQLELLLVTLSYPLVTFGQFTISYLAQDLHG